MDNVLEEHGGWMSMASWVTAERHSEPTVCVESKMCLPQWRTRVQREWIWENFQTLPEGPRAGLKDSQIAYFLCSFAGTATKPKRQIAWGPGTQTRLKF